MKEVAYIVKMPIELGDVYQAMAKEMGKEPTELMLDVLSKFAVPDSLLEAEINIKEAKIVKMKEIQKWLRKLRSER